MEIDNIFGERKIQKVTPKEEKSTRRKFNMGDDKDRYEYYQLLKLKALAENPSAIAKPTNVKEKEKIILTDEEGNYFGVKHSVVTGIHATGRNQADLIRALREDAYKRHGIKDR